MEEIKDKETARKIKSSRSYYESIIPWTYADILPKIGASPTVIMTYHAPVMGFYVGALAGSVMGTLVGVTPLVKHPIIVSAGTGGTIGSVAGMILGSALLYNTSRMGENTASGVPWNEEGIADRSERVQKNNNVRAIDLGAGTGMIIVLGSMVLSGYAPARVGLSKGPLGIFQAATLGSAVGSLVTTLAVSQKMKDK